MSSQEAGGRLAWFWNRLRCMTPAEVVHRALYAAQAKADRWLPGKSLQAEPVERLLGGVLWIKRSPAASVFDMAVYVAEAKAIARGSVRLFASQRFEVGVPPQWNRCPLTGVQAPAAAAYAVSITDRAQVGDIKYVWEHNRHLHWVVLAQAWVLSGDAAHLRALSVQIHSWLNQCPFGMGPNWTSSLEYALRLLNWSAVWQLIGGVASPLFEGTDGQDLRDRWLASINLHVRAITKHFSRHSSANNHLVGELAGIFVAAQTWPFWVSFEGLAARARLELEREVLLQITADGVLREQAFEYATFTFDFFLVVERAAAAAGRPMSSAYLARMKAMCEFIAAVTTVKGEVPQVGDADGAEAFRLDPRPGRDCFAAMQQKGAALFDQPAWLPIEAQRRDDVAWLDFSGVAGVKVRVPMDAAAQRRLDFPEGGYFLFGRDLGAPNEVLGLMDAGPLGYLGIAAHGHADALQVWLSVAGVPLLIDPGTYSYWADKPWRDYFRGTSAHNTVRVAGQDQSVSGGRFIWTRKALVAADRVVTRAPDGSTYLRASHNGYRRLPGRFNHTREVRFSTSDEAFLVVVDQVCGRSPAVVELFWHVATDWVVEIVSSTSLTLRHYGSDLCLGLSVASSATGRFDVITAQDQPPLGWCSSEYGEKSSCHTIRWAGQGSEVRIETQISFALKPI